jgi:transcriptional regulator of aromatic amino acid metabolism
MSRVKKQLPSSIVADYANYVSAAALAQKHNVSVATITARLRELGVETRGKGTHKAPRTTV